MRFFVDIDIRNSHDRCKLRYNQHLASYFDIFGFIYFWFIPLWEFLILFLMLLVRDSPLFTWTVKCTIIRSLLFLT